MIVKRLLAKLVFSSKDFSEGDFIFIYGYDIPSEEVLSGEEEHDHDAAETDFDGTIKMYIKNNKKPTISDYYGKIVRQDGNWGHENYVGEIQTHHYTSTKDMPIEDENGNVEWEEQDVLVLVLDKVEIRPEYRGKGVFRFLWDKFKEEVVHLCEVAESMNRVFYVYADFVNDDLGQFVFENLEKETGAKLLNYFELQDKYKKDTI
jgi:hypothetical protein